MKVIRIIFMVAITMALSITLISNNIEEVEELEGKKVHLKPIEVREWKPIPSKKVSRFLKEDKNPRAADHCHKNKEICFLKEGYNSTCCNNKCVDLGTDNRNCGACKNKCEFTEACCRGKCVNLAYDKRHCGSCNNHCNGGGLCIYGMCDYP